MPANGRWDLIRRLKVKEQWHVEYITWGLRLLSHVLLKIQVLWDVTLCCVILHLSILRKIKCLHIQVLKTFETSEHTQQHGATVPLHKSCYCHCGLCSQVWTADRICLPDMALIWICILDGSTNRVEFLQFGWQWRCIQISNACSQSWNYDILQERPVHNTYNRGFAGKSRGGKNIQY